MIKRTRQELIENVAERWERQYPSDRGFLGKDKEDIYIKLSNLNPLEKSAIDEIIGNDSWTRNGCEVCRKDVEEVVVLEAYEETVRVCGECLKSAIGMLEVNEMDNDKNNRKETKGTCADCLYWANRNHVPRLSNLENNILDHEDFGRCRNPYTTSWVRGDVDFVPPHYFSCVNHETNPRVELED